MKLKSDPFKLRFLFPTFPFWRSSTVSSIVPKKSCFQPVFKSEQIANAGKTAVWVLGNLTKNYLKFVVRARLRSFAFVNSWKCFKICFIFVWFQHFPTFFSFKKCVFKTYYPAKRANTLRDIESDEQRNL